MRSATMLRFFFYLVRDVMRGVLPKSTRGTGKKSLIASVISGGGVDKMIPPLYSLAESKEP